MTASKGLSMAQIMGAPRKESITQCEYFGNMDDADTYHCYKYKCKNKELCENKTNEKLKKVIGR